MTSAPAQALSETVLLPAHRALGARLAPFAGFIMPIQYSGIMEEHQACRNRCAIFDTCHMAEFRIAGEQALPDLEHLVTANLANLPPGRCRYAMLCNPQGGVIDDLVVYRLEPQRWMLVVNAGTRHRDAAWIQEHLSPGTTFIDESESTAKLDVQGPLAPGVIKAILGRPVDNLPYFGFRHERLQEQDIILSRTGYTGEIGFEIYLPNKLASAFWEQCLKLGATPAGLGARDTLRLEIGMPLYGHELSEERNAAEAGLDFAIAAEKSFIGAAPVRAGVPRQKLCGIQLEGRRTVRAGDTAWHSDDNYPIGQVTSGSFAPSLGYAVALAYINTDQAVIGRQIQVGNERKQITGTIVKTPFYQQGTARRT